MGFCFFYFYFYFDFLILDIALLVLAFPSACFCLLNLCFDRFDLRFYTNSLLKFVDDRESSPFSVSIS